MTTRRSRLTVDTLRRLSSDSNTSDSSAAGSEATSLATSAVPQALASLKGQKILVVGASSGIGLAVSGQAAKAGATVAMAARRKAKLEEASAHFGSSTKAFRCDVAVEKDAKKLLADARAWMDELDVVVFAAGSAPLALLGELDASAWAKLFATNVVGATNIVNAAMPQLRESKGTVALLSTHTVGSPWPSLAAYTTSKAALEEYAKGLHVEEPALRVLTIRIGNTATGFADSWEPERFASVFEDWIGRGLMRHQVQTADEVAEKVLLAIADREGPTELLVRGEESPPG